LEDIDGSDCGPSSGIVDVEGRIKVEVEPKEEWRCLLLDMWRLYQESYWDHKMSGVDWDKVLEKYLPLCDRVSTRRELGDVMREMAAELGASHCYEDGGNIGNRQDEEHDVKVGELTCTCLYILHIHDVKVGELGVELKWDLPLMAYEVVHLVKGDTWDEKRAGPLAMLGMGVKVRFIQLSRIT